MTSTLRAFALRFTLFAAFVSTVLAAPQAPASALAGRKPNIVFIITDDQGVGDMSCHGNPILKTPNLDRLHAEGARFTDFRVSPTCAPTRSTLFTGRHEFMNGVTHTINERERMTLKAVTLAQVLKSAGYTTGIFGKWHLGDEDAYQPERRGFDEVFIHGAGGIGQSYKGSCGDAPGNSYFDPYILHNGKFEKTKGYCTDVFFNQAMRWIEEKKDAGKPFFCYVPTNAPHGPLHVASEWSKPFEEPVAAYLGKRGDAPGQDGQGPGGKAKGKPNGNVESVSKFFGMIANIDVNVGKMLAKLKDLGLEKDTLVVFMNDNGGTAGIPIHTMGLRGSKGSPWEGGVRAISFWRWPGTLTPGDRKQFTGHMDFFPTLAALAGAAMTQEIQAQVEGRSLLPLLADPAAAWEDRTMVAHVGRWERGQAAAAKHHRCSIRDSRWSLVRDGQGKQARWELFDLHADPGQRVDLAAQHPAHVARLDQAYDAWWASALPLMVNEDAPIPAENSFKERFRKQFGDGPK